jgi:hypothetical protein
VLPVLLISSSGWVIESSALIEIIGKGGTLTIGLALPSQQFATQQLVKLEVVNQLLPLQHVYYSLASV